MSVETDRTTKLTYNDYVHFPEDGNRHEIIDGVHYVPPSPPGGHQDASRHIQFQLYRAIEERGLGRVYNAPMDLQLSETDVVQPDLMVILSEHTHYVSPSRILGPPDLIIEIVSPASADRDRNLKRKLYQQRGVPEYWIVDLDSHTVTRYRLGSTVPEAFTDEITYHVPPAEGRAEPVEAAVNLQKVW